MLLFKKIDVYGQILLIIGFVMWGLIAQSFVFVYGYFIVGGWQLLSMSMHYGGMGNMPVVKARNYYQKLIFILLIALIVFCIGGAFSRSLGYNFLFVLLITSPFIAIWYAWMSYKELKIWKAKQLVHLK